MHHAAVPASCTDRCTMQQLVHPALKNAGFSNVYFYRIKSNGKFWTDFSGPKESDLKLKVFAHSASGQI
jgi:hypothetical protein